MLVKSSEVVEKNGMGRVSDFNTTTVTITGTVLLLLLHTITTITTTTYLCYYKIKQLQSYRGRTTHLVLSKLEKEVGGISTRGEEEYKWQAAVGVSKGADQVKWRWFNVRLSQQICGNPCDVTHVEGKVQWGERVSEI